ncbi:hypothetical protein AM501_16205 [Aneurinibacillus migulanus]|uniref:RNA-binding protein Hfq n=1 Tax=Aneurinibacillus migulanus TaxID=47500 RepID=A0A0D1VZ64_ANEMI|nr:RNA chaperone Hfq [Aneurinibacillus migulanus]KIV51485.1 hypothetical protein TS64_23930 [Aneurinibacillus migulanus]KIV54973.1 hypothetical protein TS65_17475 [Aneurinibacillus migulanus]KON94427.1 hypothetical protein AF333_01915 [Aneurinibacillus migulanus]KPD07270.1 hypothetical protein AM501_16205 [Aneurinibacillus migulanus]MCP1358174.1 RNA chaperone Hfq [Aneurinibacillus migulanus]
MEKGKLQDTMLKALQKNKVPLTIFTTKGIQIRGIITAFDQYMVMVESDNKTQVLYKGAISTITPSKPVRLH